jgi:hypothetical protein
MLDGLTLTPDDLAKIDTLPIEQIRELEKLIDAEKRAGEAKAHMQRYAAIAGEFPSAIERWPIDFGPALRWKARVAPLLADDEQLAAGAKLYYRDKPKDFIRHWCVTYDPRNAGSDVPTKLPFLLFKRQDDLIDFLMACLKCEESGLIEKARDMGATWVACAFSVWLWLYWPGAAIGWGSRKEMYVDKIGDPDSIFEKMRVIIRALPASLLPAGFNPVDDMPYMKIVSPTGATITGEAGDNIGRGGRKLLYWKDESAHYERPEKVQAALDDNTRVQIDISSVNGIGNVFHRRRMAGKDWQGEPQLDKNRTAVFVMDWRDHPGKDQAWYDGRRAKAEADGLLHVFAQEVERSYSASVEGTIIPAEWVTSAIDAHKVLGFDDSGGWCGGLDVADGGGDKNALALRKGVILKSAEAWGARDTGETARRSVSACEGLGGIDLQYDSIGVGAGVKAETNRLEDEGLLPPLMRMVPWNAGASPLDRDEPIIPDDRDSPLNKDFYDNLKAQAWWTMRGRFERTHRAVQAVRDGQPNPYDPEDLISLPSDLPHLHEIQKELSQPTASRNSRMKLIVDKSPEGTRSPNLADAIIMAFHPAQGLRPVFTVTPVDIQTDLMPVPSIWRRAYAMRVESDRTCALWAAYDPASDVLYITAEHSRQFADVQTNALAIKARGEWMPGWADIDASNSKDEMQVLASLHAAKLKVMPADKSVEAGVGDMQQRLATGRLKVFSTCTQFLKEYRSYRRDSDEKITGGGLMDCARQLCRPHAIKRMVVKPSEKIIAPRRAPVGDPTAGY